MRPSLVPRGRGSVPRMSGAERAALRLARSPSVRAALETLAHQRVVAYGDSLTADALSWAEILKRTLKLVSATRGVRLDNLGVGGDTTVHLISRLPDVVAAAPDLVVVLVGTNDARRHGAAARSMLVTDRETERNLALLTRLLRDETGAALVLVTPPPVLEERIVRAPLFAREHVTWREADVARKAALVGDAHDWVLDSRAVLSAPLERLLLADGLHLSLRGQERLARLIAVGLATRSRV
jgi:lysophospholipase L1-like esterase